ncbi:MMPL family transporter [Streptomyces heilongjiangensis]|uniref:MMPL family transporter n=1 Tax=Streptomyces heilongjiangensis TaxID=945052 RepID=A0ABW1BC67_9ACTN|nr:MMPL family transporter [Streptomyces heilongjiangensis]MDC2946274.1 MMPL family transporter [Streptomyces heilongjiangensis]
MTPIADPPGEGGSSGSPRRTRPARPVRWSTWVARRRWWMLSFWGVVLVASAAAYPHLISSLAASDYSVTGSDSQQVSQLLETDFPSAGAEQDLIVFDSDTLTIEDQEYAGVVDRVVKAVRDEPGVTSVLSPTDPGMRTALSRGNAAVASVGLSGDDRERGDRAADLQDTVREAAGDGPVRAYLTGYSPTANDLTEVENADVERAESIGVPIAFLVLLVALAALVASLIPLITAVVSLTTTFGVLSVLTTVTVFDAFLLSIVTMIGVGISIDYSLFILFRFREELVRAKAAGHPDAVTRAVGRAMSTSGRTIAFSGVIVAISLLSLLVVDSPLFHGIALGAVLVVLCTLLVAWTMLPALLAALGERVDRGALPRRLRPEDETADPTGKPGGWERWARTVLARPWMALPAAALLILFTLPTAGIKLGIDLGISAISDEPSGKGAAILAEEFSAGALSPIQILASHEGSGPLDADDLRTIDTMTRSLAKDPRVADVSSVTTLLRQTTGSVTPQALQQLERNPQAQPVLAQTVNLGAGSNRTVITVVPEAAVDSSEATDLVKDLRDGTIPALTAAGGPTMLVGGETAQFADLSDETLGKLPLVMGMVLALSFGYLTVIFRSLLLPLKAVLMNLLVTFAAFGITTWVFQKGHLEGLFDFTSVGFVQVYLPIMVFALLFGLSMDYEVFLIGRMREEYLRTHDNDRAVAKGLAHTARPIAAAAVIMAAVFGCFLVADVLELKEFGLALAVAVLLDATLVRLLLVPAFMKVAGRANWWLPAFLDRHLPRVDLD